MKIVKAIVALVFVSLACGAVEPEYKWGKPEQLAAGVIWTSCQVGAPNPMRITVVRVPLKNVSLTMTGRCQDWGKPFGAPEGTESVQTTDGTLIEPAAKRTKRVTVTQFLQSMKAPADKGGVEGHPIFAFSGRGVDRPYYQDFTDPQGIFIREGQVISDDKRKRDGIFVIRKNGAVSIEKKLMPAEYDSVQFAISGKTHVRENGQCIVPASRNTPGPRIAIGLTADKSILYVVAADNGKNARYNEGGATYQDLNDIFANLKASDAIALDLGASTAIVVNNHDGKGETFLNPFESGNDGCRNSVNIGIYAAAKKKNQGPVQNSSWEEATKPADEKARGPQEIDAKIQKPLMRASWEGETVLKGQIRIAASSSKPRFKRPVTVIYALFDINGLWRYCDVMVTDQKVAYGFCAQHSKPYTPKEVSSWQPEVSAPAWMSVQIGDSKVGFFKGYHIPKNAKLMCWRIEVWQNQGLVASCESDMTSVKREGIPDDWYIKNKYSGKISYYWAPESK